MKRGCFMQLRNIYGVDLGTSTVKIYSKKRNTITKEKNMIAVRNHEDVLAVGNEAYEMYEKAPGNVTVGSPMAFGMIADIGNAEFVLQTLLHRTDRHLGRNPMLYFAVPTDMTEIETRAYYAIASAGELRKSKVFLVEKPIADALALGIPLSRTRGSMIVNFGAETTEISVLADARVIISKNIPVGGAQLDQSICEQVRKQNSLFIGRRTAGRLKMALASTDNRIQEARRIMGIDSISGLPRKDTVTSHTVSAALEEPLKTIIQEVCSFLTRIPPQIRQNIEREGIYLTGGSTRIPGIEKTFALGTACQIQLSNYYDSCTICGLKELITHEALQKYAFTARKKKK